MPVKEANHLRFAVAGCPLSTPSPGGTVEGLEHAKSLGIHAMEIEWVQNVPRDPERMALIRKTAEELDMTLTVHAPYYVNLNSPDPDKLAASVGRVHERARDVRARGSSFRLRPCGV